VGAIRQYGPSASAVLLPQLSSRNVTFDNVQNALGAGVQLRLFGKPDIDGSRRMGVALATGDSVEQAVERAKSPRLPSSFKGNKKGGLLAHTRPSFLRPGNQIGQTVILQLSTFNCFTSQFGDAIVIASFQRVSWN
jgi:hypothetical protein